MVIASVPLLVQAQAYPSRAVRVIIPFSAGGAADVPLRILGQRLSDIFKQQVVIEIGRAHV